MSTNWQVAVGAEYATAVFEPATALDQQAVFVCAHGAGGHMSDRGMLATSAELRSLGISVIRFNFLYREKASGRPDPMPRLKECVESVVKRARMELDPRPALAGVHKQWEIHWLEGADHSFHVLKSSGRTDGGVLAEVGDAAESWVTRLS